MNKEDILRLSQQENDGKLDERELAAYGKASRIGMMVGGIICICLVLIGRTVLHTPELAWAGWMLYFSMMGTHKLALYRTLKVRSNLVSGIIELLFAIAFAAALACTVVASL